MTRTQHLYANFSVTAAVIAIVAASGFVGQQLVTGLLPPLL